MAAALHVKKGLGGMRYKKGPMDFSGNLLPLYSTLMKKYRMLIYSGDTDACVPTWGTVDWIDSLNLTVKTPWKPWVSQHLGGGDDLVHHGGTRLAQHGTGMVGVVEHPLLV